MKVSNGLAEVLGKTLLLYILKSNKQNTMPIKM